MMTNVFISNPIATAPLGSSNKMIRETTSLGSVYSIGVENDSSRWKEGRQKRRRIMFVPLVKEVNQNQQ